MKPKGGRSTGGTVWINAEILGYISGASAVYATARATSTGYNQVADTAVIGQYLLGAYECDRTFLSFDTSALPSGAAVSAATLYVVASGVDQSDTDFNVQVYRYVWIETLAANQEANYDGAYGGTATLEGTLRATADGFVSGTTYSMALSAAGVNTAGDSKYTIVSSADVSGAAPIGLEVVRIARTPLPILEVTYTL